MTNNTESKRFFQRSMLCAVGIFIFFLCLFARLIYLQLIEHRFYATLSKRNVISIVPVQPNRGLIYDRNGVLLATNIPMYSLMVIPGRVKNLKESIAALTTIVQLTPDDIKKFYHIMKQYYPYQSVPLKEQLTEQEVDKFYVNQYRFPGITVQTDMLRQYPLDAAMGAVVGYVGRINARELANVDPMNYTASDEIGKAGVEKEDEVLLHGTLGSEQAEIDANGKIVRVLKTTLPVAGDNIYLTIDSKLQAAAAQLLGKNAGAVIALQPATGQVLALVTNPSFDPNLFVKGMTTAQYQTILNAPNQPLFNRALHATYAPGSTIKPFVAFTGLDDGVINKQDSIFDPGYFRLPNTKQIFHNWVRTGFGWVNVTKAITVSCDTFFYQLGTALGIDRLDEGLAQFGFGELTGVDLPDEHTGILPSPAWKEKHIGQAWYAGDTVNASIGQGFVTATPLQLAAATAAMAERGLRFQPTVLLKLQQPNALITIMQPINEPPIVAQNPTVWQTVIQAMQTVVTDPQGTAHYVFQNTAYTVAGKTGTAQLYASKPGAKNVTTLNDHLFICFAPVDNPQIVITVVVEHIPGMNERAIEIARSLLDLYMKEVKEQQATQPETAPPPPNGLVLPTPDDQDQINDNAAFTSAVLPQPDTNITIPVTSPFIPMPTTNAYSPVPDNKNKLKKQKPLSPDELEQQMDMRAATQMDVGGDQ